MLESHCHPNKNTVYAGALQTVIQCWSNKPASHVGDQLTCNPCWGPANQHPKLGTSNKCLVLGTSKPASHAGSSMQNIPCAGPTLLILLAGQLIEIIIIFSSSLLDLSVELDKCPYHSVVCTPHISAPK